MAVDSTHPEFDEVFPAWQLVRDCIKGSRAIKRGGERYLPRQAKQDDISYEGYKRRAVFFNAVKRTLQALTGFVFRQNPEVVVPETSKAMTEFVQDCTLTGKEFYDYAKDTVRDALSIGRRGTLIEWQVQLNRVFIIPYEAENIINWRYENINGRNVLTMLVLREFSETFIPLTVEEANKAPDSLDRTTYLQYRILTLEEDGNGGQFVRVVVKRKKNVTQSDRQPVTVDSLMPAGAGIPGNAPIPMPPSPDTDFVQVDEQIPMRGLQPLQRIPFIAHGSEEVNELEPVGDVPLEIIADLNIAHYMTSADFENAIHVAGSPTPIFSGFDFSDKSQNDGVYLGTHKGIVSADSSAKADFLAYDSTKASGLTTSMDKKEMQMAAQGARILEKQTSGKGVEAFETVQLRQGADTSALMTATIANSRSLSQVLQWALWWNDRTIQQPEDIEKDIAHIELNTEFIQLVMDSPMLQQLTAAYLSNALPLEDYFTKLQQGGIVSSEMEFEEFKNNLKESPASVPMVLPGADPNAPKLKNKPSTGKGAAAKAKAAKKPTAAAAGK